MNNYRQVAELVESFPSIFSPESKLVEEFVCHFGALVLVYPYCKGGVGGVVVFVLRKSREASSRPRRV